RIELIPPQDFRPSTASQPVEPDSLAIAAVRAELAGTPPSARGAAADVALPTGAPPSASAPPPIRTELALPPISEIELIPAPRLRAPAAVDEPMDPDSAAIAAVRAEL